MAVFVFMKVGQTTADKQEGGVVGQRTTMLKERVTL